MSNRAGNGRSRLAAGRIFPRAGGSASIAPHVVERARVAPGCAGFLQLTDESTGLVKGFLFNSTEHAYGDLGQLFIPAAGSLDEFQWMGLKQVPGFPNWWTSNTAPDSRPPVPMEHGRLLQALHPAYQDYGSGQFTKLDGWIAFRFEFDAPPVGSVLDEVNLSWWETPAVVDHDLVSERSLVPTFVPAPDVYLDVANATIFTPNTENSAGYHSYPLRTTAVGIEAAEAQLHIINPLRTQATVQWAFFHLNTLPTSSSFFPYPTDFSVGFAAERQYVSIPSRAVEGPQEAEVRQTGILHAVQFRPHESVHPDYYERFYLAWSYGGVEPGSGSNVDPDISPLWQHTHNPGNSHASDARHFEWLPEHHLGTLYGVDSLPPSGMRVGAHQAPGVHAPASADGAVPLDDPGYWQGGYVGATSGTFYIYPGDYPVVCPSRAWRYTVAFDPAPGASGVEECLITIKYSGTPPAVALSQAPFQAVMSAQFEVLETLPDLVLRVKPTSYDSEQLLRSDVYVAKHLWIGGVADETAPNPSYGLTTTAVSEVTAQRTLIGGSRGVMRSRPRTRRGAFDPTRR